MTMQNAEMSPRAEDRALAEWNSQVQQADQVLGASLIGGRENEETLNSLIGVPFLIERITFNQSDIVPDPKKGFFRDFVSVEALIHPSYQKKFKRDRVVFNDGSTGIYRQCVQYLGVKGMIEIREDLPEGGEANGSRYDVSYTAPVDGEPKRQSLSFETRLLAPEGLRKSDYPGPAGEATTWYLA